MMRAFELALLLVAAVAPVSAAQNAAGPAPQTTPATPRAGKVEKQNYLPSVLRHATGTEKQFLEALQKQKGQRALLDSLGLLQVPSKSVLGTVQFPGKQPEPLYSDNGETWALNHRRKLAWDHAFQDGKLSRRLLLFDPMSKGWPGAQPVTVVLTDGHFKVLAWMESGGVPMFQSAKLLPGTDSRILEITSQRRGGGTIREWIRVSPDRLQRIDDGVGR